MLVLSRKINERIMIGHDVAVTVVEVRRDSGAVRLGIEAPTHLSIHRQEIFDKIVTQGHTDQCFTSTVLIHTLKDWTHEQEVIRRIGVAIGISDPLICAQILTTLINRGVIERDGFQNYRRSPHGAQP